MFPGMGGLNPKKMQSMMKQLGMSQEEMEAKRVTIENEDGTKIVFENPSVTKMNIQGNDMFQITGDFSEETSEPEAFSEEDVKTVMEKTNSSEEDSRKALEETGDLAEAILKLSE
jgi:nascent polypeptide-associated complex subunit alpha